MSAGKRSSRWSRLGGGGSSSSSNLQDFYSTDSTAISLAQEDAADRGEQSREENRRDSSNSNNASSVSNSSPLTRADSKSNRGLVGRLRKMANPKNQQHNTEITDSNPISNSRLNNYSNRRIDSPLYSTQEQTNPDTSTSDVNFPRESISSSPSPETQIQSHERSNSRASLSSLSSKLLFGHFGSSSSSSDRDSIISSTGSGSDRDEGGVESLPSLGAMDFDIASDFGVVKSVNETNVGNGKGKGKETNSRGQLPHSVAMALKDANIEKTPRLVYGDGGASASTSSGFQGHQDEFIGSVPIIEGELEGGKNLEKSRSSIPSPIGNTNSTSNSTSNSNSNRRRYHSRHRSLEPSLIGFNMEDDEGEEFQKSTELDSKVLRISGGEMRSGSSRERRGSIDSVGTIRNETLEDENLTPNIRNEEDGDEYMPGSFFFNPSNAAKSTSSKPPEIPESSSESSLKSIQSNLGGQSRSRGESEGQEHARTERNESKSGITAGLGGMTLTSIFGTSRSESHSSKYSSYSQTFHDAGTISHSTEPSEAFHSVEPSLDDSASTLTTPDPQRSSLAFAVSDSQASVSGPGSYGTLSSEGLRTEVEPRDLPQPIRTPLSPRKTIIRKSTLIPEKQAAIPISQRWLQGDQTLGDLSEEKKHCLVKEMVSKELKWELDRVWKLNIEKNEENAVNDEEEEEDEFSIFQPSEGGEFNLSKPPSLPLLEFLVKHLFSTFPLFKFTESDFNESAFTSKDYFNESILPLLSSRQSLSLSSRVDRHGEGDGTPFSAHSTLDGIKSNFQKWLINYITAILRVDSNPSSTSILQPDGKRSVPWPPSDLLPTEAFLACRKPNVKSLRHGGMEITFASMRVRKGENGFFAVDYLLCIKKPNRKDTFIVRNEADFEQFSKSISQELGKSSGIKPLPRRGVYSDSDDEFDESDPIKQHSKNSSISSTLASRLNFGKSSTSLNSNDHSQNNKSSLGRKSSFGKSNSNLSRQRSDSVNFVNQSSDEKGSGKQFGSDATGRSSRLRKISVKSNQDNEVEQNFQDRFTTFSRRGFPISSAPSTPGLDENQQINFDLPSENEEGRGGSKSQRSSLELPRFNGLGFGSLNFGNKSKSSLKSKPSQAFGRSTSSLATSHQENNGGGSGRSSHDSKRARQASVHSDPSLPDLPNKRRRRLRAWLRDTLSVRGAVDSREARDFLSIGSFGEEDLRPSDRASMAAVSNCDERRRSEREKDEQFAGEEILELRETIDRLWEDCKLGDGFPKVLWAIQRTSTFSSLPVPYQQITAYMNLQIARFLHGTFVASDVSRGNLARLKDLFTSIPWTILSLAMKEPTGKMLEMIQDSILKPSTIQNLLAILLEDNDPESSDEQLNELKNLIHSGMMSKIEKFVEADDDFKRIVRDHAERAEIPLVVAIVRGAEEPRLSNSEMETVIAASKKYQEFMSTQPSIIRQRSNKTSEFLLISRLQRALRLLSLQRDGSQIRKAMQDPSIAFCLANLFFPLNQIFTSFRGIEGSSSSIFQFQGFFRKVLDLLSSLRARVLDPAQALNEIATLLDEGVPNWYQFLHKASISKSSKEEIENLFDWARDLASLTGFGSSDLAQIWSRPSVPLEKMVSDCESLLAFSRRKRDRQMELACRWVAGSTDVDLSIQVHGDGLGNGRTHPFFPKEPRPQRQTESLRALRSDFANACNISLSNLENRSG